MATLTTAEGFEESNYSEILAKCEEILAEWSELVVEEGNLKSSGIAQRIKIGRSLIELKKTVRAAGYRFEDFASQYLVSLRKSTRAKLMRLAQANIDPTFYFLGQERLANIIKSTATSVNDFIRNEIGEGPFRTAEAIDNACQHISKLFAPDCDDDSEAEDNVQDVAQMQDERVADILQTLSTSRDHEVATLIVGDAHLNNDFKCADEKSSSIETDHENVHDMLMSSIFEIQRLENNVNYIANNCSKKDIYNIRIAQEILVQIIETAARANSKNIMPAAFRTYQNGSFDAVNENNCI